MSGRFLRYHLPPLLWAAALFAASSIPSDELPPLVGRVWDKLLHAAAFGIFALLIERSLRHQDRSLFLRSRSVAAAILLATLYGVTDELHQMLVPGRFSSVLDVVADAAGAALALLPVLIRRRVASPPRNR
jgi:VanZ family protein